MFFYRFESHLCLKHINLTAGAYIQPKFDGIRCVARLNTKGEVVLSSRQGKQFPWFQDIRTDVRKLLSGRDTTEGTPILDGELYAHSLSSLSSGTVLNKAERFSAITGAASLKRVAPSSHEKHIELHVFDILDSTGLLDQTARFDKLDRLFRG